MTAILTRPIAKFTQKITKNISIFQIFEHFKKSQENFIKMAETSNSQILDEIPKKTEQQNVENVSNWRKFKKAFQAVFHFKDWSLTFS